jgi:hypothetical protein
MSSFSFCPSPYERSATSARHSPSYEDLRTNYREDKENKRRLAQAINETDMETFKTLYRHVDPNFAIPRKGREPIIPIFRVLVVNDRLHKNSKYKGWIPRRLLMLELLLQRGADPTITDTKGNTPLDFANKEEAAILKKYATQRSLITHVLNQ